MAPQGFACGIGGGGVKWRRRGGGIGGRGLEGWGGGLEAVERGKESVGVRVREY